MCPGCSCSFPSYCPRPSYQAAPFCPSYSWECGGVIVIISADTEDLLHAGSGPHDSFVFVLPTGRPWATLHWLCPLLLVVPFCLDGKWAGFTEHLHQPP